MEDKNPASITMTRVASSQLEEIGYDPSTKTLAIRFNGKHGRVGSLYHYANVGAKLFEDFAAAESKGSFFDKNIKHETGKYPYTRIA